jgi:hypothetical protein
MDGAHLTLKVAFGPDYHKVSLGIAPPSGGRWGKIMWRTPFFLLPALFSGTGLERTLIPHPHSISRRFWLRPQTLVH